MNCELCVVKAFPFLITYCDSHPAELLIISTEHKLEFSQGEKNLIQSIFPNRKIRWEMQSIKDHAHAHLI